MRSIGPSSLCCLLSGPHGTPASRRATLRTLLPPSTSFPSEGSRARPYRPLALTAYRQTSSGLPGCPSLTPPPRQTPLLRPQPVPRPPPTARSTLQLQMVLAPQLSSLPELSSSPAGIPSSSTSSSRTHKATPYRHPQQQPVSVTSSVTRGRKPSVRSSAASSSKEPLAMDDTSAFLPLRLPRLARLALVDVDALPDLNGVVRVTCSLDRPRRRQMLILNRPPSPRPARVVHPRALNPVRPDAPAARTRTATVAPTNGVVAPGALAAASRDPDVRPQQAGLHLSLVAVLAPAQLRPRRSPSAVVAGRHASGRRRLAPPHPRPRLPGELRAPPIVSGSLAVSPTLDPPNHQHHAPKPVSAAACSPLPLHAAA